MKGYIAITTILLISVVVLGIATTVAFVSIGEGQASFALMKGEDTLQFIDGCAEDALLKIRNNGTYSEGTTTTFTRPEGTCSITVSGPGNPKTLTVTTQDTRFKRRVQIVYNRTSTGITLVSWKEIP